MELKYIVKENGKNKTVKQILKNEFKISNRLILKLKNNNKIFVNNKNEWIDYCVSSNDVITVNLDFIEDNSNIIPTKMSLNIIYEDEAFLIIDKPAGIAVHPSILHFENSLSNGIKFYFDSINLHRLIRPVNRLDRNTSGLVIFAKNEYVQESLIKQMKENLFSKEYLCLISGNLNTASGIINAPIARKENSIIERCVSFENGQKSITEYEILKNFEKFSLVKCKLKTGRTHQIRVHMAYIGHSLLGDDLYGKSSDLINRQALHSSKIEFVHPITNKKMCFTSPVPHDMQNLINTHSI